MNQIVHADIRPIVTSQLFQVLAQTMEVLFGLLKSGERLVVFIPDKDGVWRDGNHFVGQRGEIERFHAWITEHRLALCSITERNRISFVELFFLVIKGGSSPTLCDLPSEIPSELRNQLLRVGMVTF